MDDSNDDLQAELNIENYKFEDEMEYDFEGMTKEEFAKIKPELRKQVINPEYLKINPKQLDRFV